MIAKVFKRIGYIGFCACFIQTTSFAKPLEFGLNKTQINSLNQTINDNFDNIINNTIDLTQTAAPPFKETNRAKKFMNLLQQTGLKDVEMDEEGNVMGVRAGKNKGPLLVVAAHLDTVFGADTDVNVRRDGNRLYAPGIGDDTVSLAIMLEIIKAMDNAKIQTNYDILFVGDVGEEGPGNLRGVRYLFQKGKYKDRIKYFLSLEPGSGGGYVDKAIGSKRYKVEFDGPGGHSFSDFGIVSPAYAMADAITRFSNYPVPTKDQTTFNVGIIEGGTSVNSIPHSVAMTVDMRSASNVELNKISEYFLAQLPIAVENENSKRALNRGKISYKVTNIGERASGFTPKDSFIQKSIIETYKANGLSLETSASSTDSNMPMSMGIEALTIGSGINSDGAHSLNEFIEIDKPNNVKSIVANIMLINVLANGK